MGVKIWIKNTTVYLSEWDKSKKKQVRKSTGLHITGHKLQDKEIMRMAELLRSRREMQLVAIENGLLDPDMQYITLQEYCRKRAEGKPKKNPLSKCVKYLEKFEENPLMNSLSAAWFERLRGKFLECEELAPATKENYLSALRAVFKCAVRDGVLVKSPADGIKHITVPESARTPLTVEEIKMLADAPLTGPLADEITKGFFFSCFTGLRVSDIQSLRWEHVNIEKKIIIKTMQKTKTLVTIPINSQIWPLINDGAIHRPEEFVFPGLATTGTNTNRYLYRWARIAGLKKHLSWHIARHTNATLLIESGADLYTTQRLLGHSRVATTELYAKVSDAKKREAITNLPEVFEQQQAGS